MLVPVRKDASCETHVDVNSECVYLSLGANNCLGTSGHLLMMRN